jgi:hypothetical protein
MEVQRNKLGADTKSGFMPEATTWVKIKNRQYSQAIGREDFFNRRRVTK